MPVFSSSSSSAGSIYLRCRSILDALAAVPGFTAYYHTNDEDIIDNDDEDSYIPHPFYRLWQLCRKGRVLCYLFNLLKPIHAIDLASCDKPKALVYRFIIACGKYLQMNEDDLFTVSEMYHDDTNGFVKIINTLEKILILLKHRGILTVDFPPPDPLRIIPQTLSQKVIFELLETERKYVQDLETLQSYMREIRTIVSLDMIHHMFGNLNALMDFQLRFLLFAEYHADIASTDDEQQDIGSRFGRFIVRLEDAFSVYEPYCANLQHGLDTAVQLAPQLSNTSIEPNYELPSYLIKPVQRVCKYPLLLQQLILHTTAEQDKKRQGTPPAECRRRRQDLLEGMEAIQRVASKVNETRRTQENMQWVKELQERVTDWRGITNVGRQCGLLLLHDRAFAHQAEASKEVAAHLFEKTILLCSDVPSKKQKKRKDTMGSTSNNGGANAGVGSSNNGGIGSSGSSAGSGGISSNTGGGTNINSNSTLIVIGLISISSIAQVNKDQDTEFGLRIFYSAPKDNQFLLESFMLEFRNEELLAQWDTAIQRLMANKKRSPQLTIDLPPPPLIGENSRAHDEALSPTFLSYASMNKLPLRSYSSHSYTTTTTTTTTTTSTSTTMTTTASAGCLVNPRPLQTPPPTGNEPRGLPYGSSHHNQQHTTISPPSPHSPRTGSSHFQQGGINNPPSPPPSSSSVAVVHTHRARSQSTPDISYNHHHPRSVAMQQQHMFMRRSGSATVKVKLHYNRNGTFVFYAPRNINYKDLRTLAERKTKSINKDNQQQQLIHDLIKYKDEDGDLITIHSDEDIMLAFESGTGWDAVHLYIAV